MNSEKIKTAIEKIEKFFKNHQMSEIDVAFSAGKDSSALLVLVFEALLNLKKQNFKLLLPLTIHFANTMLELPDYEKYALETLEQIKRFVKKYDLNIEVKELKPQLKNRFFNLVIGKGQLLPRRDMRWCTQRLKTVEVNSGTISIIGARKEESNDRKKRLEENDIGNGLKFIDNKITFAPIEDFTLEEVWEIIKSTNQEWLDANELENLYKSASLNKNAKYPTARFGCWLCPLAGKIDKTLHKLAEKRKVYQILEEVRNFIVQFQNCWTWNGVFVRDIYNHKDHKIKMYSFNNQNKGTVSPGGYSLKIRKLFLRKLVDAFFEIKLIEPDFPFDIYLSVEDIEYIQNIWFQEGDFDLEAFEMGYELYFPHKYKFKLSNENSNIKKLIGCFLIFENFNEAEMLQKAVLNPDENIDQLRVEILMIKEFIKNHQINEFSKKRLSLKELGEINEQYLKERGNIKQQLKEKGGVFFGDNPVFKDYILYEWEKGMAGFWPFLERYKNGEIQQPKELNIFGGFNDTEYGEYFEYLNEIKNNQDFILQSEKIPLIEKYRFIEGF